jgi:hypothetical protein
MTYSLNAHEPFEGYRIAFNGTKGRMEVRDYERQSWENEHRTDVSVSVNFGGRRQVEIPVVSGGHAGGDDRLRDAIFKNAPMPDVLKLPGSRAGTMSCLTGIAARTSIEQNRPVKIAELIKL